MLYTDGLTEARPDGAFFGEDGLTAFLTTRPRTLAEQLIRDLTHLITDFDPPPTDDIALLAITVPNLSPQHPDEHAPQRQPRQAGPVPR
nr:SpoIIE family protein phosphatase [Prauserella muralis]